MYEVIYYSQGGKTKKIAEAIAGELGVNAEDIKSKDSIAKDSLVILGSGCYGGKPAKDMEDFISRNDFAGRSVALFGTSVSQTGGEIQGMEKALTARGAKIVGSFACRGKWLFMSSGHPNEADFENARAFARTLKKATPLPASL